MRCMRTDRFQGTQRDGRVGDTHNICGGFVQVILLTVGVLVVMLSYCRLVTMPITVCMFGVMNVLSTFWICGGFVSWFDYGWCVGDSAILWRMIAFATCCHCNTTQLFHELNNIKFAHESTLHANDWQPENATLKQLGTIPCSTPLAQTSIHTVSQYCFICLPFCKSKHAGAL